VLEDAQSKIQGLIQRHAKVEGAMHDTAYEIGRKFFELYWRPEYQQIVELGSADVNGALRDHQPEGSTYIGLDLTSGKGVDLRVASGKKIPLDDEIADVIVSSSAFEHDPLFWMTFLELCRLSKPNGLIYISAPSNGIVHRYPGDYWRFYPDSGRALAAWAAMNGYDLTLVESFTANRSKDQWNDFVAVFQKGPADERADDKCLFSHFGGVNVLRGTDTELRFPSELTEDQRIINQLRSELKNASVGASVATELKVLGVKIDDLERKLSTRPMTNSPGPAEPAATPTDGASPPGASATVTEAVAPGQTISTTPAPTAGVGRRRRAIPS
jgi:SAM-dependent methyltransferase